MSLGVPLALLAQALVSCGSDSGDQACDPGAFKACVVPGQTCEAVQVCNADGSAYAACACPGGGAAGSANNGGSGGGSGVGAGGAAGAAAGGDADPVFDPADRAIGAPCVTDANCPTAPDGSTPLICIPATSSDVFVGATESGVPVAGGPQDGYCSAVCRSTTECQALDGLAGCGLIDPATGSGYCIGLCIPGAGDNAIKCLPERSQACVPPPPTSTAPFGACFPICQSDAGCGTGQFCDLGRSGLGLCSSTPPPGGDIGDPCTEATAEADCKSGLCLTFADGAGNEAGSFCSANCTYGSLAGCGFAETISVPRQAVCAQSQAVDGDFGDIGFCFELCDTDADCAQAAAGWTCSPDLTPQGQMLVGRTGLCQPPDIGPVDAGL